MKKIQTLIQEDLEDTANKDGEPIDVNRIANMSMETENKVRLLDSHHDFYDPLEPISFSSELRLMSNPSLATDNLLGTHYSSVPTGQI